MMPDSTTIQFFTLRNNSGMEVTLSNYGARVVSISVPDKKGRFDHVALGFDSISDYFMAKETYHGATIGRYANRVSKGMFSLDGKTISLTQNVNQDHLHGGVNGFHCVVWQIIGNSDTEASFQYVSLDGEEGYPGELTIEVRYQLTTNNELSIHYSATTTASTVINVTNHTYFNLSGAGYGHIDHHIVEINAAHYLPMSDKFIPTGEIKAVDSTIFDLRKPTLLGTCLKSNDDQINLAKGIDHTFVLSSQMRNKPEFAARVTDPLTGRIMEVYTTEPGIQFYTGNSLDGSDIGREGVPYTSQSAFSLETQHFPDSPNHPEFPTTILRPGEVLNSSTLYRFLVGK